MNGETLNIVADKVTFLSRKEIDPALKGGDENGSI